MRKIYQLFISSAALLGVALVPVQAQYDFNAYQPLQSSGPIPADFLQLSSLKYAQEKASISKDEKTFDKKAKREFFLESSFRLRNLLNSGKILFGDPAGVYVNQVADKLLAHDPGLRKQLRIYVVRSSAVNAFATNSGLIFINMGLLAQLETESQLAFVLAHEITHYQKKHVVNQYVEDQKIERGRSMYRSLSSEEKLLSRNHYSKELETEADLAGLDTYLKSGYSTQQLNGVFDILQYDYLPFDDVPFNKTFFESEHLVFPSSYFLTQTKAIAPPSDEDEAKSTHPSVDKRRNYILNKVAGTEAPTKQAYLVSEETFRNVRKAVRYELSLLHLSDREYEKAIYHAYLLLKEEPHSIYLQKIIAKSLYGLSKYANDDAFSRVHTDHKDVEGNSQQVFHLFEKLKPKEINALALKYTWDLKRKYPADTELPALADDLFKSLITTHCESKFDFATQRPAATTDTVTVIRVNNVDSNSRKTELAQAREDAQFIASIFIANFREKEFADTFEAYWQAKEKANQKKSETKKEQRQRMRQERRQIKKKQRITRRKGAALGIDKVVMVNPWYAKVDQRKKKSVRHLASESAEMKLNDQIQQNARLANLNVEILDDYLFNREDAQRFNDYAFLRSWMNERIAHLDASVPLQNMHSERVQTLVNRYGTKYYCWSGFAHVRERKRDAALVLLYSAMVYPLLPYGLYYTFSPEYDTYYYSLVFDITTGEPVFVDLQYIDKKGGRDVLNSIYYNTFYQLKKKR